MREWDAGSEGTRKAGKVVGGVAGGIMLLSSSGKLIVDCAVLYEQGEKPAFSKKYERNLVASSSMEAGTDLGSDILDDVMTE